MDQPPNYPEILATNQYITSETESIKNIFGMNFQYIIDS